DEVVDRRSRVVLLAPPVVVRAGTAADATEVEAQRREAGMLERLGGAKDDLVVHRAAEQGVWMADHRDGARGDALAEFEHALESAHARRDRDLADARGLGAHQGHSTSTVAEFIIFHFGRWFAGR